MMGSLEKVCTFIFTIATIPLALTTEHVYKLTEPTSITLVKNDETTLTCEMNLQPDSFQWRFFPLKQSQAANPNVPLELNRTDYIDIDRSSFRVERKKSTITIKLTNNSVAGDYQCIAHYGASAIASIPDRITVTTLEDFPNLNNAYISVTAGNTLVWRCDPPFSNPPAYIDFIKDGVDYHPVIPQKTSLVIPNITKSDSGIYKCKATNTLLQKEKKSPFNLHVNVVSYGPDEFPRFLIQPKSTYEVKKGDTVFLECGAIGTPVPNVTWEKLEGVLVKSRMEMIAGGLQISNITSQDQGIYICKHTNRVGTITHQINLIYTEAPKVNFTPNHSSLREGQEFELECNVQGIPEPKVTWLINGKNVIHDKKIEAIGNLIYFTEVQKRHAGCIQCFATNRVGTNYSSSDFKVIPKQITSSHDISTTSTSHPSHKHRKHKNRPKSGAKMVPPSKPTISRVSDDTVFVRWTVPSNDGLPIQFFKVQYRELGPSNSENGYIRSRSSAWKTTNNDIPPRFRGWNVSNLKPDHYYKFRIAAVYSNNDNSPSEKSDSFHLTRGDFDTKNPMPVPKITHVETINSTSLRLFWEYEPNPNVTVEGFYLKYLDASSAADYITETVEGDNVTSYTLDHLIPGTIYDIKIQSFNSKTAGDFSPIMKKQTDKAVIETTTPKVNTPAPPESQADSNLCVFIIPIVVLGALISSIIVFLIVCRKWKQNKNTDNNRGDRNDKPAVEEINHHIQADSNDYVVLARNNGCAIPPNRITITANPLADADNKSQNMIEMSCLSSQNNNCTASASTQEVPADVSVKGKHKKRRKVANNASDHSPGENYV